jgi:hypothetical protein
MNQQKILLLTTYPIKDPRHGGQKRGAAINDMYERNFAAVRHSAVFSRSFYAVYDTDDIPLGPQSEAKIAQSPLTGDIVSGRAIYDDPKVKEKMSRLLLDFKPDIIHIEQPFPYLGLRPLLEELGMQPKVIFGSQNIEAPMKREILEGVGVPEVAIAEAEDLIDQLEKELTAASDLVVACTKEDMKAHQAMGARRAVLAPNGVAPVKADEQARQYWQRKFSRMGVEQTVLFVGSAHPPNWTGFLDMVGKGLGFVPRQARIVVAGSISDYFEREISADALNIEDATFWLRAYSAGRLSERRLVALIQQSDVMLLPITEGGGSNLKTAEAILADKKVITTTHALRSFEWFKNFPNVWIADTQKAFQQSIAEALQAPYTQRTAEQKAQAKQVSWEYCLTDMVKEAAKL